MIDVLHVITGLGVGGAETTLVQLCVALRERGVSQHVVSLTSQDARADDLRTAGIGLTVLRADNPAKLPGALWSLMRTTNRLRPRHVQGWMYHGNLAASICHFVSRGRGDRKLLWNLRASNMDSSRYGGLIWWSSLLSPFVDVVIANSEAGVVFHRNRGFRSSRFVVIENGVDTDKFSPDPEARQLLRAELGIAEDAVVVLHVARVDPMKDHANFIEAMAQLPALVAIMAGKGTADLTASSNVRALGLRRDSERLAAAADIVASTSAYGEGFSNVIAEGMGAGLVPIATDVGDARMIVGDTGWIIPPQDRAALVGALSALAALDPVERTRLGLAARESIRRRFTIEAAARSYFELYSSNIRSED